MIQDQIYSHVSEYHNRFAWRRYLARTLDLMFFVLICIITGFVIGFFSALFGNLLGLKEKLVMPYYIASVFDFFSKFPVFDLLFSWFFTCSIFNPISYYMFGNTLGKKIWGISVTNISGNHLTLKQAFNREIKVFFRGLLFYPFSLIYQYCVLKNKNIVSWDKELNLIVSYKK